jgi:hypothetical protein
MSTGMRTHATTWALLGLLAVGALVLPVASASPTPGFTPPNPGNPPQMWAYGGSNGASATGSASGWGLSGNWSYTTSVHGFLGWNVVFTQTNTSSTAFTLQEQRALKAAVYVSASCTQGCGPSGASANLTAVLWESENAFANLTTTGTVYVNGSAVPAVAVVNAQSSVAGNLTATATWSTSTNSGNAYLSAAATANAQVSFNPALGLFPLNATPGMVWNSSSTYTAAGSYDLACHYDYQTSLGASAAGTCGASGSLSGSGPVVIAGADAGRVYVNGQTTQQLAWHVGRGPFRFADGAILLPASADLSGGAATTAAAGPVGAGAGTLSTDEVDYTASGSHVGLLAAHSTLTSSAAGGVPVGSAKGVSEMTEASSPGSYGAQAQPESVSQAQASNACLLGSCGPSSGPASGLLGLTTREMALLGAVVVIALIGAIIWVSRRATPPKPPVQSPAPQPVPGNYSGSYPGRPPA